MSHGFPYRPIRTEFGPPPKNRYPVRSAQHDMGEDIGALLIHQVAGAGMVADLATLELTVAPSGVTLAWRNEAWNVERKTSGIFAPPGLVRAGVGVIDIAYPAAITDHTEQAMPLIISGGWASVIADNAQVYTARVIPTTPRSSTCRVRLWQFSSGNWAAVDGRVLVTLK